MKLNSSETFLFILRLTDKRKRIMISFWLLLIAGAIILGYLGFLDGNVSRYFLIKIAIVLMYAFFGMFIGALVSVAFGGIYTGASKDCEWDRVKVSSYNLSSLNDGVTTSGEFFLGSGTIEGQLSYYGYREIHDGVFENVKISSNNTYIYQSDTVTIPRVETWRADKVLDNTWFLPLRGDEFTKIFVPTGTVKTSYNLNSE